MRTFVLLSRLHKFPELQTLLMALSQHPNYLVEDVKRIVLCYVSSPHCFVVQASYTDPRQPDLATK
jgi:hypothetical protein